jgi:cell division protein FtsB
MVKSSSATTRPGFQDADSTPRNWLRGVRLPGVSIVMIGIIVMAVVVLAPSLRVYLEQRQQISDLQADVEGQRADVASLRTERERWNDKSYIASQARDRLYYVLPGEVSYLVINDLEPPSTGVTNAPINSGIETTKVDWASSIFSSLMISGLVAVSPEQTQVEGTR